MRFGCCLNMVSGQPDGTGAEHLPALQLAGYNYAELPLAEMMALPNEQAHQLRNKLQSMSISCEVCNNFFPRTMRLTGEDADHPKAIAYARKALAFAASLGVQTVVFGSGPAKNVPEGFSMERGYNQVVDLLKALSPIADDNGITIVIEPLRKFECNLINTFREGCKLAEDVNCSSVKVLVDFYHMTVEQEPLSHLVEMGRRWLRHVHFANPVGRVYPTQADQTDYAPFFSALQACGYDQRISVEAYCDPYNQASPIALRLLKTLIKTNSD